MKYHFVYLVTKSSLFLSNEIYVSYLELLLIMVMANMGESWNSFPTLEKDEHEGTTLTQWWQVHVSSVQQLTLSLTFGLVGGPFPESEQRSSPWPNHSTTFWLTRGCQLGPIVIEVGRNFLPSSLTLEGTSSLLF